MVKIFIGNLSDEVESGDLRDMFEKYGEVSEADVIANKGFGFVVSELAVLVRLEHNEHFAAHARREGRRGCC